jgi:hypothetical protein
MKSTEVYRAIRQLVGPWCKQNGFKKTSSGMLGYIKPQDGRYLVFWFQCSQEGWDAYAGSKFVVEFQLSSLDHIGACAGEYTRNRLPHFLDENDLERVRQMQNRVISKLTVPPADYFVLKISDQVGKWYLSKFQSIDQPYTASDDIWFRYSDEEDVTRWSEFVLEILPKAIARLTSPGQSSNGQ